MVDPSTNQYVHTGDCAEQHPENPTPDPKKQVIDAAQSALGTATGKGLFPYGDPIQNLKNGLSGQ